MTEQEIKAIASWHDGIIPKMIKQYMQTGDHSQAYKLADALEEAGCQDTHILDHLREDDFVSTHTTFRQNEIRCAYIEYLNSQFRRNDTASCPPRVWAEIDLVLRTGNWAEGIKGCRFMKEELLKRKCESRKYTPGERVISTRSHNKKKLKFYFVTSYNNGLCTSFRLMSEELKLSSHSCIRKYDPEKDGEGT